jgi:hypothetical protein
VALTVVGLLGDYLVADREFTFLLAIRSTGILLIVSLVLLIIRPNKAEPGLLNETFWQWLVVIFVAFDLLLAARPLVPTLPAEIFRQPIASAEFLKEQPGNHRFLVDDDFAYNTIFGRYFRFARLGPSEAEFWHSLKETLVPNFGVYAALPAANNDDPLQVRHWRQLIRQLKNSDLPQQVRLLSLMNIGYFIDAAGSDVGPSIYADGNLTIQRVNGALPRAYVVPRALMVETASEAMARLLEDDFDSRREVIIMESEAAVPVRQGPDSTSGTGSVTIAESSPNQVRLLIDTPYAGYVVLTDTYYPGWTATVDGLPAPIRQANLAFRAVWVEAGQHEIEFGYRPLSFTFGLWTSILVCLIIVLLMARTLRVELPSVKGWFRGKQLPK